MELERKSCLLFSGVNLNLLIHVVLVDPGGDIPLIRLEFLGKGPFVNQAGHSGLFIIILAETAAFLLSG